MLSLPFTPAERLAGTIAMLCQAVAERIAPRFGRWRLEGPLILLICQRLRRLAAGFARLAARHAAGTLKPPRSARPRPPTAPPDPPGPPRSPARRLPRGFAWLIRLAPAVQAATGSAPAAAANLRHLLADPEMAALIAAAPQAGRLLRPLCWMLGVDPPPWLARPRRPRPPRSQPAAAPPDPAAPGAAAPETPTPLRPLHPRFRPPRWLRGGCGPPHRWA